MNPENLPRVPLSLLRLIFRPALLVLWHHVIVLNLRATVFTTSGFHCCAPLFPDCGCKITTFFRAVQIFLENSSVFCGIRGITLFYSKKSKYVKIYYIVLIHWTILRLICFNTDKKSPTRFRACDFFFKLFRSRSLHLDICSWWVRWRRVWRIRRRTFFLTHSLEANCQMGRRIFF